MKQKKYIALLLALLLTVILLPAAFADGGYDSCVLGTWNVCANYDTGSGEYRLMNEAVSRLVIRDDGTASYSLGDGTYEAVWSYTAGIDSGYIYGLTLRFDGNDLPLTLACCTEGPLADTVVLFVGDTLYQYKKA